MTTVRSAAARNLDDDARTRILVRIADLERQVLTLTDLADSATAYYRVFILGETDRKTDLQIETDFISEVTSRMVATGQMKPDQRDDPSFSSRLGK